MPLDLPWAELEQAASSVGLDFDPVIFEVVDWETMAMLAAYGGFPRRYLAQFGLELSGITREQVSWRWFAEWAGTTCDVLKSEPLWGCGYRQRIYESRYTYYRRIIGHGLDNDARVVSLGGVVVSEAGNSWHVLGRIGELNKVGVDPDHSVAITPQDLASIDIQHRRYTKFGQIDVGIGFERREDIATGVNVRDTRGYLQWTYVWGG